MSSRRSWKQLVPLVAVLASVPAVALAQTEAQKQQAREHYERGKRSYDVGRYAEAIEAYQQAYLAVDDPILLYNIAQAYRLWDKPEEAVRFYRNYLRRSPDAKNRTEVERKIDDLEKAMDESRRPPAPSKPPVGETPPAVMPSPPPPTPSVVSPTPPPMATMPPPVMSPETPAPEAEPEPAVEEARPGRGRRLAGWAFIGGGGVLVVTAMIAGGVANRKEEDIEKLARAGQVFDPKIESDGQVASAVAIATGLAGLAMGATGAILLLTGQSPEEAPSARAGEGRLALFPLAAPGLVGGGARIRF